jgi:hypothetical protein
MPGLSDYHCLLLGMVWARSELRLGEVRVRVLCLQKIAFKIAWDRDLPDKV